VSSAASRSAVLLCRSCFGQDAVWAGSGIHRSGTHCLCSGSSGAVPRRSGASPAGPSPVSADCFVLGPFGGH
jgi:hypothetical protein